jgi:hypothetical protein
MPSPARQSEEKKPHQVYWDAEPWQRILRAAEVLWKRQTVDQGPVTRPTSSAMAPCGMLMKCWPTSQTKAS